MTASLASGHVVGPAPLVFGLSPLYSAIHVYSPGSAGVKLAVYTVLGGLLSPATSTSIGVNPVGVSVQLLGPTNVNVIVPFASAPSVALIVGYVAFGPFVPG